MIDIDKKKVLGRGATATIFQAKKGSKDYAAKIFHQGKNINVKKIEAMMAHPPKNKSMKIDGLSFLQFAWPTEFIYSDKNEITGFLMPLIDLKNSFSLDVFYDRVLFHKLNSPNEVALTFKLAIAKNLASAVADLHKDKHYFIDLKPQNIRVAKGTHAVTLLDCDGFSISGKDGSRFPAELISTDYIAPEVTNKNESPKNLGEAQDLYALAVILFQLLNNGTHPFQGIIKNNLKANTNDEKAARGYYPHGLKSHSYIDSRPQSIHATFLESTRKLFDTAFVGNVSTRPKASAWAKHFDEILKKKLVVRCEKKSNDLSHLRFKDMDCPACYLEKINGSVKVKKNKSNQTKSSRQNTSNKPPSSTSSTTSPGVNMQALWWIVGVIVIIIAILSKFENNSSNYSTKNYSSSSSSTNTYKPEPQVDSRDCINISGYCDGYINFTNAHYTGQAENGKRHGFGTTKWTSGPSTGCEYNGEHREDEIIGEGILKCSNGVILEGHFKNGDLNGYGKKVFINGEIHEGNFINGDLNGYGVGKTKDGYMFEGEWINGNPDNGKLTSKDGTSKEVFWKDGKFDVIEDAVIETKKYIPTPTKKSKAQIDEEIRQAQERIKEEHERNQRGSGYKGNYNQGDADLGDYENLSKQDDSDQKNKPCPEVGGKCYGDNYYGGNRYSGDWFNGIPHGNGVMYFTGNERVDGKFINGSANGYGSWYKDGHRWDGEFENNYMKGCGTYFYPDGNSQPMQAGQGGWYVCNLDSNENDNSSNNNYENESQSDSNGLVDFLFKKPDKETSSQGSFGK